MFMFHALSTPSSATRRSRQLGQATAEYALVILGAAAVAGLALAWAVGTGKIGRLLDAVLNSVIGQVG
ncbi:MAG: DUF4244 domain-containing protein [Acidimicrobiales bacterium]